MQRGEAWEEDGDEDPDEEETIWTSFAKGNTQSLSAAVRRLGWRETSNFDDDGSSSSSSSDQEHFALPVNPNPAPRPTVHSARKKKQRGNVDRKIERDEDEEDNATTNVTATSATRKFEDYYELQKAIGEGYSASVHICVDKATREKYACKVIEKSKMPAVMMKNEVSILKKAQHPNVIKFIDVFETPTKVYLILELASEGELFDRVIARGAFPEAEARALVYTIANTVQFLHEKGIMHRDLKPENVLFARDKLSNEEIVKLADFGFASCYDANSTINMDCGSGEYAAPELLNKKLCTLASDIWSIGVVAYILLCGFHPFQADDQSLFMRRIVHADFSFPSPEWDNVSDEAKELITSILQIDPSKRPTAEEITRHPWFSLDLTAGRRARR